MYAAFYYLPLSPPFKQLCSDLVHPHPLSTCITTYNLQGFSVFSNTPMPPHETHGGLVSVWHVNRLQLINTSINSYFARSAKLPQLMPLKSECVFPSTIMSHPYVSVSDYAGWFEGALRDGRKKKKPGGGRRLTEDREKMRHRSRKWKTRQKTEWEQKPNSNKKTEMGPWKRVKERARGLEREQNRLLYKKRAGESVRGKQLSRGVSQCGGRLIRKCAPPPAGLATSSCCGQLI